MAERGDSASRHDCSICLNSFKIPKILPCFHTFCLQCLEEYVIRNGQDGQFECPLCRVCTEIPVGGVKSFQSNFYIQGGNASEQYADCEVCGEGHEATHYCTDCEENFCERCTTSHMKMKVSREHTLLKLKAMPDKDGNYTRMIQKKYFCSQHKGEEVKMICKDCDTKLCVVCKLTEHENHNTSSIAKEAEERRASLLNTIASAKMHLESLKKKDNIAINLATDMEKELEANLDLLEKRVKSVTAKVKMDANSIKLQLIKSISKAKDYYLEKGKLIHGKIIENEAIITHAQNVVELGDDIQALDTKLFSKLQSLELSDECLIKHPERLAFEASSSDISDDILGKQSFHIYMWREEEMPGPTCIVINALDRAVCLGYPAAHKVTLNASDGTVLSVFSGEGCHGNPGIFCPLSVFFDSQRCIVIADYNNGTVIRIDKYCNFLQCLVERKTPLSVLLGDDDTLYVGFEGGTITKYQLKPKK